MVFIPNKSKGFTLVELAIVLVIIGLLIGGILVAKSMVRTAEMMRVIKDISQLLIITQNFISNYQCVPGDCNKGFVPSTYAGSGDGIISYSLDSRLFKPQLALMGMYTTSDDLSDCRNSYSWSTAPLKCHFTGSLKGSIMYLTDAQATVSTTRGTIYGYPYMNAINTEADQQYIHYGGSSGLGSNYPVRGFFKPSDAKAVDAKVDDGMPSAGKVQGLVTYPDFQASADRLHGALHF